MRYLQHLCLVFLFTISSYSQAVDSVASVEKVDPYALSAPLDITLFTMGTAMTLTGLATRDYKVPILSEVLQLDPQDVNAFDRRATDNWNPSFDKASDVFLAISAVMPATISIFKPARHAWYKNFIIYYEAIGLTAGVLLMTKSFAGRYRPAAYNSDLSIDIRMDDDNRESFYSGHSAYSFMAATLFAQFLCDYYPESRYKPLFWVGSLSVSTLAAVFRIPAGKHFPTDVLTGASMGTATALFTIISHKIVAKKRRVKPVVAASITGDVQMGILIGF